MQQVLVYTTEGHPTAARLTRIRKKYGTKFFQRNAALYAGEIEPCRMVVVEDGQSAVAQAYLGAGFVFDKAKNRRVTPSKPTVRILRARSPYQTPASIDLDGDDRSRVETDEYLKQNIPPTKTGKQKLRDSKAKKAKRKF